MILFKKNEPKTSDFSQQKAATPVTTPKMKKRIRVGFGNNAKEQKHHNEETTTTPIPDTVNENDNKQLPSSFPRDVEKQFESTDIFLNELAVNTLKKENLQGTETEVEQNWQTSKRKTFVQKDMTGKQVYLEDTGERLGNVFDAVYDDDKNLIGYKIKDSKSETILSFPLDQFDEDKNGLIFIPSWYNKGLKTIEKLEFKDRITPELTWLITDKTITTEELYNIFVKHDDIIAHYIEEAIALQELINNRLKILEKERVSLKETLMDLTEKRLIKDIDRRQFSEIVMNHRRKVNVLDINIKKCKDLLDRLEHTSFGMLSKTFTATVENEEKTEEQHHITNPQSKPVLQENKRNDLYKEKYLELKQRYETLQESHNELKIAVEKLLSKNE
jgi:hypothetical protein